MSPGGYTVEVTGLSPKATEKDVHDFFTYSGVIEHVEIVRSGEYACTAYVTFKDAYSQETAVLLSGATIMDQRVFITRWGHYEDEFDFWSRPSRSNEYETNSTQSAERSEFPSGGDAVTMAQEVVKSMLVKGFVLGKDALSKAHAFDESHQVSSNATAKVAELSERFGLTDKLCAGVETVRSMDEKYHFSDYTKSAVSATGRTAVAAANSVVNSSYFSKGAVWMSDALMRAANVAAEMGNRDVGH